VSDVLARLAVDGVPVAEYVDGAGLDRTLAPRPYLHPVRTLAGVVVTDARPADHPWHLGVSVAIPDVDGANLWGGPTYRHGEGYTWRDDHGRIVHAGFDHLDDGGFTERLHWLAPGGELLHTERRRVRARPAERGWELEVVTTLRNAPGRPVRLGSPATNGREGAGYGGLFCRLAPAGNPQVRTAAAVGEDAVHGSGAPWLAWTDRDVTLGFARTGEAPADPWFVRVADYPGVGLQLAAREPVTVDGAVTWGLRVLVADGVLDDGAVEHWAAAPSPVHGSP
jgi:Methane oxygenase PmoA